MFGRDEEKVERVATSGDRWKENDEKWLVVSVSGREIKHRKVSSHLALLPTKRFSRWRWHGLFTQTRQKSDQRPVPYT